VSSPAATLRPSPEASEVRRRLRQIPPPPAVLDREREQGLTRRQHQLLDGLDSMFDDGFTHLTMAEIAARSKCSLRTLYGLAPSRDELVLVVVDRSLWRVGRRAMEAISPDMGPVEAVRAYLHAAAAAVAGITDAFARDLEVMPAAQRLGGFHADYVLAVTRCLLDLAVERDDLVAGDTGAAAWVMAGLAAQLSRPAARPILSSTPIEAADYLVDVLLRGMEGRPSGDRLRTAGSPRRKRTT
jgi:AcrR family transcriptional regulator